MEGDGRGPVDVDDEHLKGLCRESAYCGGESSDRWVLNSAEVEECVERVCAEGVELESRVVVLGCVNHLHSRQINRSRKNTVFDVGRRRYCHRGRVEGSRHHSHYDESVHIGYGGSDHHRGQPRKGRGQTQDRDCVNLDVGAK